MDHSIDPAPEPERAIRLGELATVFLKLGVLAFGGPAVHIAMMEEEVVRRRRWIAPQEFLDLLGAANLIPGPNSTELAIHIGRVRAGWRGLVVAGTCFILPAALIVTLLAWAYVRYSTVPALVGLLYGIKPVVIAIVVQALWRLGRSAITSVRLAMVAGIALLAAGLGVHELLILIGAGILMLPVRRTTLPAIPLISWDGAGPRLSAMTAGLAGASLWPLFWTFLKIGGTLFGSGYVLLAYLRADFVIRLGWLTERQLLDAVAVGQITPGPVFTTATFVGYLVAGGNGAAVATGGIFLPAFVLVLATAPYVTVLRSSPVASRVLDGVNAASLALMGLVTWHLGRSALIDGPTVALSLLSLGILLRRHWNSAWLILAGAVAGIALKS